MAIAISLLLHALLLAVVMRWQPARTKVPPPRPPLKVLVVPAARQEPPPPPPSLPAPRPSDAAQPQPKLARSAPAPTRIPPEPQPAPAPEPAPQPGPPQHRMKSASGGSAAPGAAGAGSRKGGGAVYAPPDYAEKVKALVNQAIVYPADARRFLQQCWVEYTLTVDRDGNMLGYKIENCGDDRLDAAARAALIKGGPYPPPPDTGASSYEIHGAFVFTLR